MKPTHLLIATLLFCNQLVLAQSSNKLDSKAITYIDKAQIECIYKYTINAPLRDSINKTKLETYSTILQANATTSKFWDWNSFKKDSIAYFSSPAITMDSIKRNIGRYYTDKKELFIPVIIKNYPKGQLTVTDEIVPNEFIYSENKTNLKWELTDDTLTVCTYHCLKATTSYAGLKWTAWYTPEITLSDGPWKLCGLPGLILKAQDSTATHIFEATSIQNAYFPIYLSKNIARIKTTKSAFIKSKNSFEENIKRNLEKNLGSLKQAISISINRSIGKICFDDKCYSIKFETKYCPLEFY